MDLFLNSLKPGESARIVKITGTGAIKRRLFDMGMTPGAQLRVRKVAPLGDPMEITLRGYELSLRNNEAAMVVVEREKGVQS